MTFMSHPTPADASTRTIGEIGALILSLTAWQKQLEVRESAVRELGSTSYRAAICADRAEEAKADVLLDAARLFEVNELYDLYGDQCNECGIPSKAVPMAATLNARIDEIAAVRSAI